MAGAVLALPGGLGSGKTQFVKGLSPGSEQRGRDQPHIHSHSRIFRRGACRFIISIFSGLKIGNRRSRLGLDDYFFGNGVSVVEWADRFPELIPENALWITFEPKSENVTREPITRCATNENSCARTLHCARKPIVRRIWSADATEFFREWANDRKNSGAFFENLQEVSRNNLADRIRSSWALVPDPMPECESRFRLPSGCKRQRMRGWSEFRRSARWTRGARIPCDRRRAPEFVFPRAHSRATNWSKDRNCLPKTNCAANWIRC